MGFQSLLVVFFAVISMSFCVPEEGKWDIKLFSNKNFFINKNVFKDAKLFIKINCQSTIPDAKLEINWAVLQSPCWNPYDTCQQAQIIMETRKVIKNSSIYHSIETHSCNDHIFLQEEENHNKSSDGRVFTFARDGVYVLGLGVIFDNPNYTVGVQIEIKSDYGYLSAADWPLLPFYGFMCTYYIILGLIWLVMSFLQWRDLLRVQFWIGGVILLGMLEKATFYAEIQNINNTGKYYHHRAILFAEWVSCAKRTLARMLVIIVSLGFGIVKPRLGSTLHRVVGVGILYFFLAASEAYLRNASTTSNFTKDVLIASVPLAVLDSAICWWIFSALVNTTRTLRLRRNEAKLSLYRHFTNTLIFSVVASIVFMLFWLKEHHYVECLTVWKDMWLENTFWHILFSCILLVIMILWRPTNNNQRYAFVPLLDTGDDNEEEEHLVNDAYGVKVRIHHPKQHNSPRNSVDDDLRWLEENVKSDPALPILDSDEELVNTRFEVSKMQ